MFLGRLLSFLSTHALVSFQLCGRFERRLKYNDKWQSDPGEACVFKVKLNVDYSGSGPFSGHLTRCSEYGSLQRGLSSFGTFTFARNSAESWPESTSEAEWAQVSENTVGPILIVLTTRSYALTSDATGVANAVWPLKTGV